MKTLKYYRFDKEIMNQFEKLVISLAWWITNSLCELNGKLS